MSDPDFGWSGNIFLENFGQSIMKKGYVFSLHRLTEHTSVENVARYIPLIVENTDSQVTKRFQRTI